MIGNYGRVVNNMQTINTKFPCIVEIHGQKSIRHGGSIMILTQ